MKIGEIQYEKLRGELLSQLKADERFKDFNFEASGISTLLNILAYNTHYLGQYMFAVNNESSIDTAQTRQSVYSKARGLGYTPKGMKSSIVEVVFKTVVDKFPYDGYVTLHAGKGIQGSSVRESKQRNFTNIDNIYLYDWKKLPNGKFEFHSKPTLIYEGEHRFWEFVVDTSVKYQSFVIKDPTIDIDTLRVFVKDSDKDDGKQFYFNYSMFDIDHKSNCFYTSVTHDGFVEVHFGANVFGKQPTDGQIIHCQYMSTSGEMGNGCTTFILPGYTIETNEVSNSGSDGESIETTRFNAINHFKAQNRLITPDDYRSVILQHFRNIQAINVWRGEDNYIKQYGKIFVSVKPYYTDKLSDGAKRSIVAKLVDRTKQLGADPVFVDPNFIECDIEVFIATNMSHSSVSIEKVKDEALQAVNQYDTEQLNVFGNSLSDVELNDRIRKASVHIDSSYTRKKLRKRTTVDLHGIGTNTLFFGNTVVPGSVTASYTHNNYNVSITDEDGVLFALLQYTTAEGALVEKEVQIGTIDYKRGSLEFTHPLKQAGYTEVEFTITPSKPDIYSVFNNIVRIANVRIANEQ